MTELKTHSLAQLEELGHSGGTIIITKCGRPLATVGPAPRRAWKSSEGVWVGKVSIPDHELMADTSNLWEVVRARQMN